MAHAILGPSSANMWINCPGSARLNEMVGETESEYAKEGTLAHALCELMLRKYTKEISPQKYGSEFKKIAADPMYNAEMLDHCTAYLTFVTSFEGETLVEQKLEFSAWVPEGFGTGDAIKVTDSLLTVIDFKYGKGVKVEAEDNTQLKLYALGAIVALGSIYDFEEVEVHIFQPRLGEPTSAKYTVEEIIDWADSIKSVAQKAWDGVEEYKSGSHCKWCKVKATCLTRMNEQAVNAFDDAFIEPTDELPIPNQMGEADILYWLPLIGPLSKWLTDLEKFAQSQAESGHHFEGWKLVEGRSNRCYSDTEAVINVLDIEGVEGYLKPQELLGITALEKVMGKKEFERIVSPLLIKPPGKPTLVPMSDKREPLESAKDVFAD